MSTVKCLVWDLDETLWRGTLLEQGIEGVVPAARRALEELDRRGILHSIASRNEVASAETELRRHGLFDYFVAPQIGWGAKSAAIAAIGERLRIGLDSIAFVDDQRFELDEVRHAHPKVRCYSAEQLDELLDLPEFTPEAITPAARARREMYQAEQRRHEAEEGFTGPKVEFLAGLDLCLEVWRARPADLARAAELTVRTHQLNTTGVTFTEPELAELARRDDHVVLLARLTDRYGDYGTIGLAVVEKGRPWRLRLLLMSCRVLGRGVGGSFLGFVTDLATAAGADLEADLVPNDRNRMMLVTLRLAGFAPVADDARRLHRPAGPLPGPAHVRVVDGG